MINSDAGSGEDDVGERRDAGVDAILRSGARGGLVLAGIAPAVVIGIWVLF
jgi:hypothetical protein